MAMSRRSSQRAIHTATRMKAPTVNSSLRTDHSVNLDLPALMPTLSIEPAQDLQRQHAPDDDRHHVAPALGAVAQRHPHHEHGETDQQHQSCQRNGKIHEMTLRLQRVQHAAERGDEHQRHEVGAHDEQRLGEARLDARLLRGCLAALGIAHVPPEPPGDDDRRGDGDQLDQGRRREQRLKLAAHVAQQFLHRLLLFRPRPVTRSCVQVGDQLALEPCDLVLQHELALLQPP
jgi:hypothetical protein